MNSRERYEYYSKNGIDKRTPEEVIEQLVNILIKALYIPAEGWDSITKTDPKRFEQFGIENEPINWGDLKCNEVKKFEDGSFLVTVDEAAPGVCQTFCQYIEKYMLSYGWQVRVETEW